jgi:hypothetical protein
MNKDHRQITEAYKRIYLEADSDFRDEDLRGSALDHEDLKKEQDDVNQIEEDEKTFKYQTRTKYVSVIYQPEGYDQKISAYGEIIKIVAPGKALVRMRSGPDQVNQSGPNSSVVPNKFGSNGKDFTFDYEIKYFPKRSPKVIFPSQDGKYISDIGDSVNVGQLRQFDSSSSRLLPKQEQ